MKQESRVRLEVDLKKLSGNFNEIRRRVVPTAVMAVLKANAYGLGVLPVAETVKAAGAACFGVAEINEAIELAKGFDEPETVRFINGILGGFMRSRGEAASEAPAAESATEE